MAGADDAAMAHSRRVAEHIRRRIEAAGGWLSFAEYMNLALYAPGLGYYTAGAAKFGAAGDFVTAPELTPLFGRAVARQAAQVLADCGGGILELGAGGGRLAADLLAELERLDRLPDRYAILEVSPELRRRQRQWLGEAVPHLLARVEWLDGLPTRFTGFVLGNEVLDALPVHLLHRSGDAAAERGVALEDGRFVWAERPLPAGPLRTAASLLPAGAGDYLSEVCPAAPALVRGLAEGLARGVVVFLDYGMPRAEYYHPRRSRGTLLCHYRHRVHEDPFFLPGLADITAHVDFTAVADAALEAGLEVPGYTTQARFLVNCGILDLLGRLDPDTLDYMKQASAVQQLVQPTEMGERFKAIALARGVAGPLIGFIAGDQRQRL